MKLVIKIFIGIFTLVNAYSSDTLNLREAIETALEKNYSVRLVKKTSEIARNNYSVGNSGMLPKVDAYGAASISMTDLEMEIAGGRTIPDSGNVGGNIIIAKDGNVTRNYNAGVDLNMTLFDGFAMFISYDKYEAIYGKSLIEIQFAIESILRNLINSYYEALKLQKRLEIIKESIEISRERLERTKDRMEYGAGLKVEVYRAEVDLNTDSSNYMQTELAYNNMLRNLNYVMGRNIDEVYAVDDKPEMEAIDDYKNILSNAYNKNSLLLKAIQDKKISEYDYKIVNSFYYPRVSFKTGYSFTRQESDAGYMLMNQNIGFNAGISASMNLFDGLKTNIQRQNAEVNILINEIKVEDTRKQIELAISNAYDNYDRRKQILKLEEENLQTASLNYERSTELYKLGQMTSIEFRDAQLNLMNARSRVFEALYSTKVAESELMLLSGLFGVEKI